MLVFASLVASAAPIPYPLISEVPVHVTVDGTLVGAAFDERTLTFELAAGQGFELRCGAKVFTEPPAPRSITIEVVVTTGLGPCRRSPAQLATIFGTHPPTGGGLTDIFGAGDGRSALGPSAKVVGLSCVMGCGLAADLMKRPLERKLTGLHHCVKGGGVENLRLRVDPEASPSIVVQGGGDPVASCITEAAQSWDLAKTASSWTIDRLGP